MERVCLLLASILVVASGKCSSTSSDASVLLCFKDSLENNTSLESWNISVPLHSWKGTVWRENRVLGINVSSAGLSGELAPSAFWCHLPSLEYIILSQNNLRGLLPHHGKCHMSQLYGLDLAGNMFNGSIPEFIFSMPRLAYIFLYDNKLSGRIPASIINCTSLIDVILAYNSLGGTLPNELGRLWRLKRLHLAHNNITGTIPSSLSNCSQLQILDLSVNHFSGIALTALSNLSQLITVDLQANLFSGETPRLDGNTRLQHLWLAGNDFTAIHGSVFALESLRSLRLHFNSFSGRIPSSIGNLSDMRVLILGYNKFHGSLPPTIGMLRKLKVMDVGYNRLTGNLPESMVSMSSLEYLAVTTNSMSGQLPSWIGGLDRLRMLDLWRNHFTGTIPKEFGNLAYLRSPRSKPTDDPDTNFLNDLGIEFLPTGGSAKDDLSNIPYKNYPTTLDFCDNNFTGLIPEELGNLQSLQHLWLCTNNLTGPIPSSLGNMTSLILLQLYENHLTGSIPPQLGQVSSLEYFNVSFNNLTGRIPSSTQFTTFEQSSFIGNPGLCGFPLQNVCQHSEGRAQAAAPATPPGSTSREFRTSFITAAAVSFTVMLLTTPFLLRDAYLLVLLDKVVHLHGYCLSLRAKCKKNAN